MLNNLPFTLNNLLTSIAIIIAFIIAGIIISWFAQRYLKRWAEKSKSQLDDILVSKIRPPFSYVIWFIGIKLALKPLNLNYQALDQILNSIVLIIALYMAVVVADILVKGVLEKITARTESTMDDALLPLISKVISAIIIVIGLLWLLGIWKIDITPLLASLGIAGLALSFAVKDSLANIIGGVSLILDQTIMVGDKVKLESGESGYIEDVGLRSTKLRTFSNVLITIPNGQLANSRIQNYVQPSLPLRVEVPFGVSYDADVDYVRKVIHDVLKNMEGIDNEERLPEVLFISMEDYYLKLEARFWVSDYGDAWKQKLEATDKIFRALKKNNINIPFPTQTILLQK